MKALTIIFFIAILTLQQNAPSQIYNHDPKVTENKTIILSSDTASARIVESKKGKKYFYSRIVK